MAFVKLTLIFFYFMKIFIERDFFEWEKTFLLHFFYSSKIYKFSFQKINFKIFFNFNFYPFYLSIQLAIVNNSDHHFSAKKLFSLFFKHFFDILLIVRWMMDFNFLISTSNMVLEGIGMLREKRAWICFQWNFN